jgi:hypothetical protein
MMTSSRFLSVTGVLFLAVVGLVAREARAQVLFDHQECFRIQDKRDVPPNVPITLTPFQSAQFFASTGCQLLPLKRPRAKELCVMADKNPANAPFGPELQVDYLCYRARCNAGPNVTTSHPATDQFGSGTVRAIQRGRIRKVCVPATLPGLPTPTPVPTAVPSATPTPVPTPAPTPTQPYGSASRAFVNPVASLLF